MSSVQYLREFVSERLTAAAEEIFGVFEKTIVEYEAEIDRQRRLLDIVWKPEIKLHRIELPQQHVCKEEEVLTDQQLWNQHRNSSLDPEPPQVKEEQEEVCTSQEGEQLVLKQETQTFMLSPAESMTKKRYHNNTSHRNNVDNSATTKSLCETHTELPQQHVCKEEEVLTDQQLWNQHRNSSLDPEPPQVKEEQEEVCTSQEGEQLVVKQATQTFMLTPTHGPEPNRDHQLLSHCSAAAENQDQRGGQHVDPGPTRDAESMAKCHCNTHTDKKSFKCDTCGKVFHYLSQLNVHLRRHTGEKPYVCDTCGKRFSQKSSLNDHLKIHTDEKPYVCDTCGRRFSHKKSLNDHLKIHTGEKPYSCKTCGKSVRTARALVVHMRTHTGEKPYPCNTCGKRFSDAPMLNKHIRIHTGEKPYSCKTCGKCFGRSYSLLIHVRTHTGEKPYSCTTCGKRFSDASTLNKHVKTHSGDHPYSCEMCGESLRTSRSLLVHMRNHTNERPFVCNTCGKRFYRMTHLRRHIRTHTGQK